VRGYDIEGGEGTRSPDVFLLRKSVKKTNPNRHLRTEIGIYGL
jgi:hypothetical protein